jgi:hypothetical protein
MKRTLLLLASVLMSAASFAQEFTATWEKPVVTNFVDMADDGATTQFLYNVGAKGFFVGHNDWNTRASVANYGDSVRMKALEGDTFNFGCYPAKYTNKNKWLYVSANAWNAQWVDAGNATGNTSYPGTDTWVVTKQENGSYKFTNTGVGADGTIDENNGGDLLNPDVPAAGSPWGVAETCMGETPNTRCYFYDPTAQYIPQVDGEYLDAELAFPEGSAFWDEWRFVSVEEYTNVYIPELERYLAAVNLKEKIEYALGNEIPAADLADYYAVYNNLSSTTEELEQAAAAAYDMGRWPEIKEYFENIEQGEKNDVSGVFVNPDFETGNVNGWDITWKGDTDEASNIGYQGKEGGYTNGDVTINKFIEAWKKNAAPNWLGDGSITQTVPSLPKGKYMLAVDVVARDQWRNALPDDVQLFAKASLDGKEYFIPMATGDGKPEHFEFTFVHTGGSMTLGLRVINSAEAKNPANWIAMDNLKLYYYGETADDPDKILLDAAIEKAIEEYDPEDMDDIYAYTGHKAAYVTAMESAKQISEEGGDYVAAKEALLLASDTLKLSIAAYGTFEALREEAIERTEEFAGTKFEGIALVIGDLLQDWDEAYEYGTYTIEKIEGLPDLLAKTINDYVSDNLEAGDNITFMIKNANFDKDFSGWDYTGTSPVWGGKDQDNTIETDIPLPTSGNAERYHAQFDMFQTIKNMPAGLYQFSCQAFERDDSGQGIETFLYAIVNDVEQKVAAPNQLDYATDEKLYNTGGDDGAWPNDSKVSGDKYVPNSMTGAYYHFAHVTDGNEYPDYTAKLNITLEETADITFGIKCTNANDWVIFDNFQLVYLGSGNDAFMIAINEKLDAMKKYIDNNEENIGTDVKDLYDSLLDQSTKLGEDEGAAFLETVENAITYAESSVEAYTKADEAMNNLATAVDESDNESAKAAASTFDTTYADAIANRDLTVDGVNAALATISDLIDALNTPDYSEASDDNPVDFTKRIVNNGFETGNLNGWINSGSINAQAQGNKAFDHTVDGYYAERWHVSGTIDLNQTVKQLPAGTYELTAYVYSSATDCKLYAYGTEVDVTTSLLYSVIFTLEEADDVTFGVKWSDTGDKWTCMDDFKLTYYGTESKQTPTEIEGIADGTAVKANGKFFEKGRIFIMRNGVKYNVAGQIIE